MHSLVCSWTESNLWFLEQWRGKSTSKNNHALYLSTTTCSPRYVFKEMEEVPSNNPVSLRYWAIDSDIHMFSRNATILTVNYSTITSSGWTHLIASSLAISTTQIVPNITQRLKDNNPIEALRFHIFLYQCPRYQVSQHPTPWCGWKGRYRDRSSALIKPIIRPRCLRVIRWRQERCELNRIWPATYSTKRLVPCSLATGGKSYSPN
jgi:hypothetical protein